MINKSPPGLHSRYDSVLLPHPNSVCVLTHSSCCCLLAHVRVLYPKTQVSLCTRQGLGWCRGIQSAEIWRLHLPSPDMRRQSGLQSSTLFWSRSSVPAWPRVQVAQCHRTSSFYHCLQSQHGFISRNHSTKRETDQTSREYGQSSCRHAVQSSLGCGFYV